MADLTIDLQPGESRELVIRVTAAECPEPEPCPVPKPVPPLENFGKYKTQFVNSVPVLHYNNVPDDFYDLKGSLIALRKWLPLSTYQDALIQADRYRSNYLLGNQTINGKKGAWNLYVEGERRQRDLNSLNRVITTFPFQKDDYRDLQHSNQQERTLALVTKSKMDFLAVAGFEQIQIIESERVKVNYLLEWLQESVMRFTRPNEVWKPFYFALCARTLIEATETGLIDASLLIKEVADELWRHWSDSAKAFPYEVGNSSYPTPDLTLMISPIYGWIFKKTGDEWYRVAHDAIFNTGVDAPIYGTKQFAQRYLWSWAGVEWTGRNLFE